MRPYVLRLFIASCFSLFAMGAAQAGDTAQVEILGFSADGSIFAFEEYGVQDGSGFAYANRYYINTADDSFMPGTPIRVTTQEDGASVADARAKARAQGQAVAGDAILAQNRGYTAGWNAVTEMSADFKRMTVNPRPVAPAIDTALEFRVKDLPMPEAAECYGFGEAAGFRLTRIAVSPGVQTRIVHEDTSIPASRGCPLSYRIAGVQTFYPENAAPVFAVIIAVERVGFEGPDFRFIAVTGKL